MSLILFDEGQLQSQYMFFLFKGMLNRHYVFFYGLKSSSSQAPRG